MIIRLDMGIRSRNILDRWNHGARKKHRKEWEKNIWAECNGKPPKATGKVKLVITSVREKFLDTDNLWGGVKDLLDAMQDLGVILNDNPTMLELDVRQIKSQGQRSGQTILEIVEAS